MIGLFQHGSKNRSMVVVLLGILSLSVSSASQARNLGVQGSVYEIAEPDMLTGIKQKLAHLNETGELSRQQKVITQRSISHMLRPQPVQGISIVQQGEEPITRQFNPSIIIGHDITDTKGRVIAEKGRAFNPFDYSGFGETFIFIDADKPEQIRWLKKKLDANEGQTKPIRVILTKGDVKVASDELGVRVYFDQRGYLCRHFSITRVPVIVSQRGREKRLLIQEVKLG